MLVLQTSADTHQQNLRYIWVTVSILELRIL